MFSFNILEILKGYTMRIQRISRAGQSVSFKSLRTDKHAVSQLKAGEKPIIENNRQNIYAALNNISANPNRNDIEFLLDIADNLAYGQNGDSEFKRILDLDGNTPPQRENTDWHAVLSDTIKRALNTSDEDIDDLELEYDRIFGSEKPLTPEQKKLLDLRKTLTGMLCNDSTVEDAETLSRCANIRKNLDYFAASSEIPIKQKEECLEKFVYFLSDDYKITPQLEDKKLQVLDEMLNDMIIKTPQEDVLTIKDVDQLYSGICAAISICRKAVAYEDKTAYTDIVLEELKDSPVMSVYDITELGSGKKVDIPKTEIDYDTALARGYRIIDTSAHNWMQNAHACGNGTVLTEHYIPFDNDSYGVYDDTSWYEGLETNLPEEKALLKALIKERAALESLQKEKQRITGAHTNVMSAKRQAIQMQSRAEARLTDILQEVFPSKNGREITELEKSLYSFYTGTSDNNEINVSSQLSAEQKRLKLEGFITQNTPAITEEEALNLSKNSKRIYEMVDEYTKQGKNIDALKSFNTKTSKYRYYKKLFNLAAAHRLAVEADLDMPYGVFKFERLTGMPPREEQIMNYMQTLKNNAQSIAVQRRFAENTGGEPSKDKLTSEIVKDMIILESEIPAEIDSVLKAFSGKNLTELTAYVYSSLEAAVNNGGEEELETAAGLMGVKKDKKAVLEALDERIQKLNNSPSFEERNKLIRDLGYQDSMSFASALVSSFINSLQDGISEETYNHLAKEFGGQDKVLDGIMLQREKFINSMKKYNYLLDKWQVPSSKILILDELEKGQNVLTRSKLDILKSRFDYIQSETFKNNQIKNVKERKKANSKLYSFPPQEKEILESIESAVAGMKKYCKTEYRAVNKNLREALDSQYANIGMLNGQFWVGEEGSTGLTATEQLRIVEQMTGKPYHIETDINTAAKTIKKGDSSGLIALSVDDSDYAFHVQYVPYVSTKDGKDEIIWMDNSWGRVEDDYYWKDENGTEYTDYGNGYGWGKGFVLNDENLIGLPVADFRGAAGRHKENTVSVLDVPDKIQDFGLFRDVILPEIQPDTYQKLYEAFEPVFEMQTYITSYDKLEQDAASGAKLNLKRLSGIEEAAEKKYDDLCKRLDYEIKTKADFDRLPEDDELKFQMDKLALYLSTANPANANKVLRVQNRGELVWAYQDIRGTQLNVIAKITAKSEDCVYELYEDAHDELDQLFQMTEQETGCIIPETNREKILNDIFLDSESISQLDGSISSLEKYLIDKVPLSIKGYIDTEAAAEYFVPRAQDIIKKYVDTHLRITSLDSPNLAQSLLRDEFIAIIDKYYNPESDEELLSIIQSLQEADSDTAGNFFEQLDNEDLGIKLLPSYEYVLKYKERNIDITQLFSESVMTGFVYSELNSEDDGIYRELLAALLELDVQKHIKAYKAEAFDKYQVRQAFPEPVVIADSDIKETAKGVFDSLKDEVASIKHSERYINLFSVYEDFIRDFSNTKIYNDIINMKDIPLNSEDKTEIKAMAGSLRKLCEAASIDSDCVVIFASAADFVEKLNSGNISCAELYSDLKLINSTFSDWETSSVSKSRFIQLHKDTLKGIRYMIQLLVNTNVQKKYRNEIIGELNRLVTMYKKDADDAGIKKFEDEIADNIAKKHVVKAPAALLEECVELAQDNKTDTEEYKIKKKYLQDAIRTAKLTKVQYKLVENQSDGISSKIKDMLSLFCVTLEDGSTASMDEQAGLVYLVEQLKNAGDGNKTLNLFLRQSGLSQQVLSALIETFDIEQVKKMADERYNGIKDGIKALDDIIQSSNVFIKQNETNYKSLPEAVKGLRDYIARKFPQESNAAAKKYIEYLDSLNFEKAHLNIAPSLIMTYVSSVNTDALQLILEDTVNNDIGFMGEIADLLTERMELLESIDVPQNSAEEKMRSDFRNKYDETELYIASLIEEIFNTISSSEGLDTH